MARVAKMAGISPWAIRIPLMSPISSAKTKPRSNAGAAPIPPLKSASDQVTLIAMMATIERSMPRPMMVMAIPEPRSPRIATFWIRDRTFDAVRKPDTKILNNTNSTAERPRTIRSWLSPPTTLFVEAADIDQPPSRIRLALRFAAFVYE
jgi:hypothetical protein